MNWVTDVLSNIGLSIAASSVWAIVGLVLYRRVRASLLAVAYFKLYTGLDRLKGELESIMDTVGTNAQDLIDSSRAMNAHEKTLERYASAINYEWTVSHLPYEDKVAGLVWMYDLDFVLSNAKEVVNEISSMGQVATSGGPVETMDEHRESLGGIVPEILEAIGGQLAAIPDKHKNLG